MCVLIGLGRTRGQGARHREARLGGLRWNPHPSSSFWVPITSLPRPVNLGRKAELRSGPFLVCLLHRLHNNAQGSWVAQKGSP